MSVATTEQNKPPASKPLEAWKCNNCGLRLADVYLVSGSVIEAKCPRCRAMNTMSKP